MGCTDDKCDETVDSCANVPNHALCVDPYFCTVNERCDPVMDCVTDPKDCSDSVACTRDECDETGDTCTHALDHAFCADESFCNGDELCDPAAGDPVTGCMESPSLRDCSDDIECTVDACDEDADTCLNQPDDMFCQDGLFCTINDRCDPLQGCLYENMVCDDGIDCTEDSCDDDIDACVYNPREELCADGNECTQDICDLAAGCLNPIEPDASVFG